MIAARQWPKDKPLPDPEQFLTRKLLDDAQGDGLRADQARCADQGTELRTLGLPSRQYETKPGPRGPGFAVYGESGQSGVGVLRPPAGQAILDELHQPVIISDSAAKTIRPANTMSTL